MMFVWLVTGFLIGSLVEWLAHRYLLHNLKLRSISHAHFRIHHKNTRHNDGYDSDYESIIPKGYDHGWSEIIFLLIAVTLALPLIYVSFWLWFALLIHAFSYYWLHRKFHLQPQWGKRWMPWHWDHHMIGNQNSNWGVTNPIFDWVFSTRVKQNGNKRQRKQ